MLDVFENILAFALSILPKCIYCVSNSKTFRIDGDQASISKCRQEFKGLPHNWLAQLLAIAKLARVTNRQFSKGFNPEPILEQRMIWTLINAFKYRKLKDKYFQLFSTDERDQKF
ncbi:hypothetical protein HNY73_016443 [Argiope bruennichi]|uniref:Uncharacterized protein n=1 Tax=Argiope bruennichi TaxID=94029 RepID=A0A8T0EIS8_ARGBR|nr:hypothetical protein HNY73_016443 [Argiope bruennichi]